MNSIYLFCGGNKHYPNKKSKPLQKFGGKNELIISHLDHIKNYFDKISYLVEKDEVSIFSKLLKKVVKNPKIIEVKNSSSTIEKLKESMKHMKEEYACVSYPDIFCDSNFWEISKMNDFTVSRVSISSRFPRIYSDIFTDVVKGVSNYQSKVPANPHFIYGGKFDFKVSEMKKFLKVFNSEIKDFEIDFLDSLAQENTLIAKTIYGDWFHIDSDRDYSNMIKMYGKSS